MNILILGNSQAGAWQMRGEQLGAALGARVTLAPTADDYRWADIVVLVKRAILEFGLAARRSGKPVVWDALDFWSQPAQNRLDRASALLIAHHHMAPVQPDLVIGATQAMAEAIGGQYLPHHNWAGLQPTPAREHVSVVGYQGNAVYLGRWAAWLDAACRSRGWSFVINPPDLSQVDILVAFRDGLWDGWICREWKSGVKLVNAIAAGRPIVGQMSAAWAELMPTGTLADARGDLDLALDLLAPYEVRAGVVERARRQCEAFTRSAVAAQYRTLLERVPCRA